MPASSQAASNSMMTRFTQNIFARAPPRARAKNFASCAPGFSSIHKIHMIHMIHMIHQRSGGASPPICGIAARRPGSAADVAELTS